MQPGPAVSDIARTHSSPQGSHLEKIHDAPPQRLIVQQQMSKYRDDADHDAGHELRMHKIGKRFQILRKISLYQEKPKQAFKVLP
ncbi:MAG: hypothetical protein R3B95_20405 [Nitrospirales bacterium]|nr:hypothetical protein [Nitrospirales bacterium]